MKKVYCEYDGREIFGTSKPGVIEITDYLCIKPNPSIACFFRGYWCSLGELIKDIKERSKLANKRHKL